MAISRQKEARSRDYALLLFRMTSRVLCSVQYHRQHCTLQAFEQFQTLYMHSHDDKYPAPPGFEPSTSRLQAPVDTNEPSGPAIYTNTIHDWMLQKYILIKLRACTEGDSHQVVSLIVTNCPRQIVCVSIA